VPYLTKSSVVTEQAVAVAPGTGGPVANWEVPYLTKSSVVTEQAVSDAPGTGGP
jgi:hypothetical protein